MRVFVIIITITVLFGSLFAETLDERLQRLAEDAGKEYVQPLVTSFGTNLNSGLFNTADVLKPSVLRPIRFGFSFHTMIAMIPDSDKTFEAENPVPGEEPITTATVFGDKGGSYMGEQIFPNGFDVSLVPLFVPQFRFGLPKGNEILIRYLPPLDLGDYGEVNFWGVGLKHSVDQYIPLFPVHLAVQGAYQSLTIGDFVDLTSIALNAQVSKRLLMLTLYGGLGWESTKLEAAYDYTDPITDEVRKVSFDVTGDNNIRLTAGFRYALIPFVHLNADYTISAYQAASFGLGFTF